MIKNEAWMLQKEIEQRGRLKPKNTDAQQSYRQRKIKQELRQEYVSTKMVHFYLDHLFNSPVT